MSTKKGGYIGKFLKKADSTLHDGVKSADKILDDAVELGEATAKQAAKAGKEIHGKAKQEGPKLQKKGMKTINDKISRIRDMKSNPADDLALLEKLASLRDSGIINDDEFNEKKKKILDRI